MPSIGPRFPQILKNSSAASRAFARHKPDTAQPQAAADAALARLVAQAAGSARDPAVAISIAEVYAFRGDDDEALKWLTRALQQRSGRNWTREEVIQSPFLKSLHADARWHTLLVSADTP